jgi:hypothetical protein
MVYLKVQNIYIFLIYLLLMSNIYIITIWLDEEKGGRFKKLIFRIFNLTNSACKLYETKII